MGAIGEVAEAATPGGDVTVKVTAVELVPPPLTAFEAVTVTLYVHALSGVPINWPVEVFIERPLGNPVADQETTGEPPKEANWVFGA